MMIDLPKFTEEQIRQFAEFNQKLYDNLPDAPGEHEEANVALFKKAWGEDFDLQMCSFLIWFFTREGFPQ
jgi:hypothetical protein